MLAVTRSPGRANDSPLPRVLAPPRLGAALAVAAVWTVILLPLWRSDMAALLLRTLSASLFALLAWGLLEFWPRAAWSALRRRTLQWTGLSVTLIAVLVGIYLLDTRPGQVPLWQDPGRLTSLYVVALVGLLLASASLLGWLWRRAENAATAQLALHEAERIQLQKQSVDDQLRLLRGQQKPQFLLRLLDDARAQAARHPERVDELFELLLGYLRDTLPRLDAPYATLGGELALARDYLALIARQPGLPPSLLVDIPDEAETLACPPRMLLELVERAARRIRSRECSDGRIDLWAREARGRCVLRISDSAPADDDASGEPLAAFRRRLLLAWDDTVTLQRWQRTPQGEVVEIDFPARRRPRPE